MTDNFQIDEFLQNRWATPEEQKRIYASLTPELKANLQELATNLQVLSDHIGNATIHINIAFRPLWWELSRGRSGKSQHVLCKAADIVVEGYTPAEVAAIIQQLIDEGKMKAGGLHAYDNFTHYDIRGKNARW